MKELPEIYACLYAAEFPAQSLLRLRPELQDKSFVVMEEEPPQQRVCSLNSKARLLGIRRGMTSVEVDTFEKSTVMNRSAQAERMTKAILLECARLYSPRVEEWSKANVFLCGIDIAGTQSLFGPPEMLARNLRQQVRALGISARVTVSSNLHTAICVAKGPLSRSGVQIVAIGEEASTLDPLSLTVLDLSEAHAETFAMWGIHTLGALAALPEEKLIARLGQEGKRLHQLACGKGPHLFQPIEVPFTLEEQMDLDCRLDDLQALQFVFSVMLDQLIVRASARVLALASISYSLRLDGGGYFTRTVSSRVPTNEKRLWLKLLHLDVEAHSLQASIVKVCLKAEPGGVSRVQLGLFSSQLPEPGKLDITLARISALVGEGNVGHPVLDDTNLPDGYHIAPFNLVGGDVAKSVTVQPRSCIRYLRPPERVSVVFTEGLLTRFYFRECSYKVDRSYGPWLMSGEWWSEIIWGQEQWDLIAQAKDGTLLFCCIVRDLIRNCWQMEALYD